MAARRRLGLAAGEHAGAGKIVWPHGGVPLQRL